MEDKFNVVARIMNGTKVDYYIIENKTIGKIKVTKDKLIESVENGLIGNCEVNKNGNTKILRGIGVNLNRLKSFNMKDSGTPKKENKKIYNITHRIMNGNECLGYVINGVINATREEVIQLIREKKVDNAEIQTIHKEKGSDNKSVMIRGRGVNLRNLPTIKY